MRRIGTTRPHRVAAASACDSAPLRAWLLTVTIAVAACGAPASGPAVADDPGVYRIEYRLEPVPRREGVSVTLTVSQDDHLLRQYDMRLGAVNPDSVTGDGEVSVEDGRALWRVPEDGGELSWFVPLQLERGNGAYDAYITPDWALLRAEDAIPVVRTVSLRGAVSNTELSFDLPSGWSSLTQYLGENHRYPVDNPEREFDRPTGWMLLGKFGRRNEDIAGVRVVVAGPTGQAVRRMDTLALLQWNLPEIVNVLPDFPSRLTIFSAGAPMWRGGLSAPTSLFIHADRPLISENGTSSLIHEVMHVGIGLRSAGDADWLVEGLAEYYSLEVMRRTGTISLKRYGLAREQLREWSKEAGPLCQDRSTGATTALAVQVLSQLDQEIRAQSQYSLDDVLRRLVMENKELSIASVQTVAEELVGFAPETLDEDNLPGCADKG